MRRNLPNLFLIGAMKSGTSSLHAQLSRHPQVFMSRPKEPCYFVDPDWLKATWPQMWERGYWRSEESYLALFAEAGGCPVIGESSTDYAKLPANPGIAEKIARFNPAARFIYIMRDPIRRTLSHYWHMVEHRSERRGPLEALRDNPVYCQVSQYAVQLAPFVETFGRERVHALTFEHYIADPEAAGRRIYAWLGIEPDWQDPGAGEKKNATPGTVYQERGTGLLNRFRYSRAWSMTEGLVPAPVRRFGRSLAQRPVRRAEVDADAQRRAIKLLRPRQLEETEALRALLGRDFPEWKTLYAEDID
jgi:hypothetical protein